MKSVLFIVLVQFDFIYSFIIAARLMKLAEHSKKGVQQPSLSPSPSPSRVQWHKLFPFTWHSLVCRTFCHHARNTYSSRPEIGDTPDTSNRPHATPDRAPHAGCIDRGFGCHSRRTTKVVVSLKKSKISNSISIEINLNKNKKSL